MAPWSRGTAPVCNTLPGNCEVDSPLHDSDDRLVSTRASIASAWILISLTLSGCDWIEFAQRSNRLRDMADSTQEDLTTTDVTATRDASGRQTALLSAFFGLDDGLPRFANRVFCSGAAGKDGMPVVFSHEVDVETLEAGDFRVVTEAGIVGEITCVTPAPAEDVGEARTILIVGQYGSADDQPASVEIVGNLLSKDGQLNFIGARVAATALEEGPTMVWSEIVPESEWDLGNRCPLGTSQVVRVTWAGGVTKPGGDEIDDVERSAYSVTISDDDGDQTILVPFAIADLDDGDNNHELCLDQAGTPLIVEFPAGLLTDPREDLNPATRVAVTGR